MQEWQFYFLHVNASIISNKEIVKGRILKLQILVIGLSLCMQPTKARSGWEFLKLKMNI